MRNHLLALTIAAALPACGAFDELDKVDVPIESQATIPGDPLAGNVPFENQEFPSPPVDFKKKLADQDVSVDDVASLKLVELTFAATAPQDATIDFLTSIEVFVEAEGMQRQKIAEQKAIPDGARTIDLETLDVELKPFARANAMQLITVVSGTPPLANTTVKTTAIFLVDAGLL